MRYFHTLEERSRSGRIGARATHGQPVVYVDGKPVMLDQISEQTGVPMITLRARIERARQKKKAITMEMLTMPYQSHNAHFGRKQEKPAYTITVNRSRWAGKETNAIDL